MRLALLVVLAAESLPEAPANATAAEAPRADAGAEPEPGPEQVPPEPGPELAEAERSGSPPFPIDKELWGALAGAFAVVACLIGVVEHYRDTARADVQSFSANFSLTTRRRREIKLCFEAQLQPPAIEP